MNVLQKVPPCPRGPLSSDLLQKMNAYPEEPLTQTLRARAEAVANRQMLAVEQTMRLEDQSVADSNLRLETRDRLLEQLLKRPARLWDHP